MRFFRLQILGWLLVLVPTGLTAVKLLQWSRHEQELLHRRLHESTLAQAQAVAGEIRLAAADMRDGVAEALEAIPASQWETDLPRWADSDPRLGQAFIWEPPGRLLWPPEGDKQTQSARSFRFRYRALFEGRQAWEHEKAEERMAAAEPLPAAASQPTATAPSPMRMAGRAMRPSADPPVDTEVAKGGVRWTAWFDDNRLHLLAWRRDPLTQRIGGVELELMSLLSRLVPALAANPLPEDMTIQLRDAAGYVLHQSGPGDPPGMPMPDRRFSLEPELPTWEMAVSLPAAPLSSKALGMAMGMTVFALVSAVLAGGILLTREAGRERREALRKTGFVSNVSHELKTPLTSIRLYTELLAEGRVPETRKQRYFDILLCECGRLSRLIGNVLDFGRLEQGRRRYRTDNLELEPLLCRIIENHSLLLEQAGMQAELNVPPECRVKADPNALEQIIANLIDNAVKYAASGREINIAAVREGDWVSIQFMDRGPGVEGGRQHRLFQAFQGGDAHLSAEQHGAGLGLSIVKGLAEGMGGEVRFQPREGGGAVFEIRLRTSFVAPIDRSRFPETGPRAGGARLRFLLTGNRTKRVGVSG